MTFKMGKLKQLSDWFQQQLMHRMNWRTVMNEYYLRAEARDGVPSAVAQRYKRQAVMYREKTIDDWRIAVTAATDPDDPRRGLLYRFYQSLYLDEHLQTTIDNRVLPVQQSEFRLVDKSGKENEEATELLRRPWFHELMRLCFLHRMQGVTLVDLSHLDDNLEIAFVEEIPMSNYIPQQGIILREESDTAGWSYREGALEPYYVQFGNAWSLGMLNELAIILLAKKLGMGSWMNYIEKYGVPPVFILSDRQDAKRMNDLYEMMLDFRNNYFGILGGQERVEYGKEAGGNTTDAFLPLEERCDNQISKRMLGQTGTTENGAWDGTAKVHERVEKTRHQSDKMLFRFYFNYIIIPKLVKISPVYRLLENLRLEWDETETLDIREYIDSVNKLSANFDFDYEEVAKRTGLPITGQKNVSPDGQPAGPTPPDPQKKKSEPGRRESGIAATVNALYYPDGTMPEAAAGLSLAEKIRERVLQRLAGKGFDVEKDIDPDLFEHTFARLNKAMDKGYGKVEYGTPDDDFLRELRHNNAVFAAFKTHRQQNEIHALLFDEDGKRKDFDRFRKDTESVLHNYNVNWLRTEYDTAVRRARFAADFREAQANKDLYPNLEWLSSVSVHPREVHRAFYGQIRASDDPFWSTNYPGNLWNCKCRVRSTDKPVNATGEGVPVPAANGLDKNPAISAELFTESHPYIKGASAEAKKAVDQFVEKLEFSERMPVELRPDGEYLKGKNIRFKKEFFDLIDNTPGKEIRFRIEKEGAISYYMPDVSKVWKGKRLVNLPEKERRMVNIADNERNRLSDWHREKVVYHEFGHAIDAQRRLFESKELANLMAKQRFELSERREYTIHEWGYDRDKKQFGYTKGVKKMYAIEYADMRLRALENRISDMQDEVFTRRGITKKDVLNQILATRDTIQALNPQFGAGHSRSYYATVGMSEKEFIAHCFENAFAGNKVFKKYLPNLYDEMVSYVRSLTPPQ